jgi:hypothetical protein
MKKNQAPAEFTINGIKIRRRAPRSFKATEDNRHA